MSISGAADVLNEAEGNISRIAKRRMRSKLCNVKEWAKANRSKMPLGDLWQIFCQKLRGHINYYGVSFNMRRVEAFIHASLRILHRWLNRRGSRHRITAEKFYLFIKSRPYPRATVRHAIFGLSNQ